MIEVQTNLSRGFQITLPSAIRKEHGLQAGDPLTITSNKGVISIKKAQTPEEKIRQIFSEFKSLRVEREKSMTPEQKAFAEMSRGWTANQFHEYFDNLPENIAKRKAKYGI